MCFAHTRACARPCASKHGMPHCVRTPTACRAQGVQPTKHASPRPHRTLSPRPWTSTCMQMRPRTTHGGYRYAQDRRCGADGTVLGAQAVCAHDDGDRHGCQRARRSQMTITGTCAGWTIGCSMRNLTSCWRTCLRKTNWWSKCLLAAACLQPTLLEGCVSGNPGCSVRALSRAGDVRINRSFS